MVFEATRPTTTTTEVNNLDTTTSILISPPPPLVVKGKSSSTVSKRSVVPPTATSGKKEATAATGEQNGSSHTSEDVRKKRCSDRYDSSESSDSGVAVLSCTDSSTASSDSSDPGSPYSPSSLEETLLASQKSQKQSDQHIIQSSTVSSSCKADVPMLVRGTGGVVNNMPTTTVNTKGLMHSWSSNWNGGASVDVLPKLVPTNAAPALVSGLKAMPLLGIASNNKHNGPTSAKKGKNNSCSPLTTKVLAPALGCSPVSSSITAAQNGGSPHSNAVKPQTKITGFFKTQMKPSQPLLTTSSGTGNVAMMTSTGALTVPPMVKKDLTNLVIRSKEFPKINNQQPTKKSTNGNRKNSAERKQRANGNGAKNPHAPVQGNTLKDIIMKKPVNIAPRIDSLPQAAQQPQQTQSNQQVINTDQQTQASQNAAAATAATFSRIAQQPQLVLTAFRVAPEQQLRMPQNTNGTSAGSANSAVENKSHAPVQFQYPLNGSFMSFANLLSQSTQPLGTGMGDGKPQIPNQQQQIFLSQLGAAIGKPSNAQFILNGTLVKLANQGTTIEPCGGNGNNTNRANPATNGEGVDMKAPPALISTTAIPTVLATSNSSPAKQTHQNAAPMFMSVGQNGQFILNTTGIAPLALANSNSNSSATTQGPSVGGAAAPANVPPVMPSLQPISLSSFTAQDSHMGHQQQLPNAHLVRTAGSVVTKRRPMPPQLSSSPPDLVLLPPIAKAMAAAAAAGKKAMGKAAALNNNKQIKPVAVVGIEGALNVKPNPVGPTKTHVALISPKLAKNGAEKEQKIVSKVLTTTEVVRQTTTTTTTRTVLQTTTKKTTETTVAKQEAGDQNEKNTVTMTEEQVQVAASFSPMEVEKPHLPPLTVVPPSLTSPKSLVLEKLKLKSESTIRSSSSNESLLVISTDCLDVAHRQLGVLVDQQQLECAKSPILSQPKTIRFPVRDGTELNGKRQRKSGGYVSGNCYWEECNARFENSSKLLDHLQTHHVTGQSGPFKCLWQGCRVNGRESCSRRWLEGHVSSHGGSKTFKCIFEGCGHRFSSQLALQKHVNIHLSSSEKEGQPNSNRKSTEGGAGGKYLKRNGKKLRYRRQPWSARMFDFFDAGIMEGLQHRLVASAQIAADEMLQLRGRELARRTVKKTSEVLTEVYVEWTPADIIPDDWVCVTPGKTSQYLVSVSPLIKSVPIRELSHAEQCALQKHLRKSYTMPLEVDTTMGFLQTAFKDEVAEAEDRDDIQLNQKESSSSMAMEQDSDSGKGTQRCESSVASPVSYSCKSEVRKLKRKSKSLSSESAASEPATDDSGLQTNAESNLNNNTNVNTTAKKHLRGEGESDCKKKKKAVVKKEGVVAQKAGQESPRKRAQYSKGDEQDKKKRRSDGAPQKTAAVSGRKMVKRESC